MKYGPHRSREPLFAHDRRQSFAIGWTVIALVALIGIGIFAGA